tara:strand:- start:763 stop:1686 length:924 start_codon:yes stop_codon:yes gene_type:complete
MSQLSPSAVFAQISEAVPTSCHENIVVIGSLAAGYHYFHDDGSMGVRTKDVDCVLEPFQQAVNAGKDTVRALLDAGWKRRMIGDHIELGDESTPEDELPAVRLYPPDIDPEEEGAWFIEFLTVPENEDSPAKKWTRLPLDEGHFGIPSFRFLSIAAYEPINAEGLGIRYARPEMMALANLLEHPEIKDAPMKGPFAGRTIKRSNKDLGRVLAIAVLSGLDDFSGWLPQWKKALQACFPASWKELSSRAGNGLQELLDSGEDLEEAHHTCANGLLSSRAVTVEQLGIAGQRLQVDVIEPMGEWAEGGD